MERQQGTGRKGILGRNAGFSLIELIVTVTIVGILSVAGIVGLAQSAGRSNAQYLEAVKSVLDVTRTKTMAMGDSVSLEIKLHNSKYIAVIHAPDDEGETHVVGKDTTLFEIASGDDAVPVTASAPLIVRYNMDGSIKSMSCGDADFGESSCVLSAAGTKDVLFISGLTGRAFIKGETKAHE